jgi:hypothetical protein
MLSNIQNYNNMCQYLNRVGGDCAPVSAFITQIPKEKNNAYCFETLILSASFNETDHRLEIVNNSTQQTVYSGAWQAGPAENVKVSVLSTPCGTGCINLQPNTTFKAILTVKSNKNDCGDEDSYEYVFTTGNGCQLGYATRVECPGFATNEGGSSSSIMILHITPNPGTGTIVVNFDGDQDEQFVISAHHLQTGSTSTLVSNYVTSDGMNAVSLNIGTLPTGQYQISAISAQKYYQGTFIKL